LPKIRNSRSFPRVSKMNSSQFLKISGVLLLAGLALAESDGFARVLVAKQIQNKYLVEGKDIVVRYGLYNTGESAAVDVELNENGFAASDFDVVAGQTKVRLDRLGAGANHSHTLVVRPKKFGYFNFTSAEVKYQPAEHVEQIQVGYSSEPGQGLIIALRDYEKQFSAHMLDWIAFAVMTLPSLSVPFLLWNSSKSKYERIAAQSKRD